METLTETEYRLMVVIWEKQNLTSMELVNICMTKFAWKKSTTYTMLKKLEKKGMIKNQRKSAENRGHSSPVQSARQRE